MSINSTHAASSCCDNFEDKTIAIPHESERQHTLLIYRRIMATQASVKVVQWKIE